jgi:hypothetical protein
LWFFGYEVWALGFVRLDDGTMWDGSSSIVANHTR